MSVKLEIFSYASVLTYVLGAQKSRLIETVLLSTHNICFGLEIRKLFFFLVHTLNFTLVKHMFVHCNFIFSSSFN